MTNYIALLRAVNVAGHQPISMADLRALAASLGFGGPRTLLQSGNLVFEARAATTSSLEKKLEDAARARLGLDTQFMVRTSADWDELVAANPFPDEARDDPGHLLVMVLKGVPTAAAVKGLAAGIKGPESVRAHGPHLFVTYPAGVGRSKLTNAVIEKALGTRATGRNWNTVLKLQLLAGASK